MANGVDSINIACNTSILQLVGVGNGFVLFQLLVKLVRSLEALRDEPRRPQEDIPRVLYVDKLRRLLPGASHHRWPQGVCTEAVLHFRSK